jgi:hypothetical protein
MALSALQRLTLMMRTGSDPKVGSREQLDQPTRSADAKTTDATTYQGYFSILFLSARDVFILRGAA